MLGSLPSFARLEAELSKLPGIGRKTAARLAFHLLRTSEQDVEALAAALLEMRRKVHFCRRCFHIAEEELCQICSNPVRENRSLCVVQEPQDLLAIERSHSYSGLYHVLHGALSPLDGIGPGELGLDLLEQRLKEGGIKELILATNPTVEGETTAHYISEMAAEYQVESTRLAHGIPLGGELEYIDGGTLAHAFSGRQKLNR